MARNKGAKLRKPIITTVQPFELNGMLFEATTVGNKTTAKPGYLNTKTKIYKDAKNYLSYALAAYKRAVKKQRDAAPPVILGIHIQDGTVQAALAMDPKTLKHMRVLVIDQDWQGATKTYTIEDGPHLVVPHQAVLHDPQIEKCEILDDLWTRFTTVGPDNIYDDDYTDDTDEELRIVPGKGYSEPPRVIVKPDDSQELDPALGGLPTTQQPGNEALD